MDFPHGGIVPTGHGPLPPGWLSLTDGGGADGGDSGATGADSRPVFGPADGAGSPGTPADTPRESAATRGVPWPDAVATPAGKNSISLDAGGDAGYQYDPSQPWMTADIPRPGEQWSEKLGRFVFWPVIKNYVRNRENPTPLPIAPKDELGDWTKMDNDLAILHQIGKGAEYNQKFTTRDGHGEAVYDGNGQLVLDPVNQGTYNHYDPIRHPVMHTLADVVPYMILGNNPQDTTTVNDRINQTIEYLRRKWGH